MEDDLYNFQERVMTVAELKAQFSDVLARVQNGERVKVLYGKARKPVAIITPVENSGPRRLGSMDGIAKFYEVEDSKISEEEFLGL